MKVNEASITCHTYWFRQRCPSGRETLHEIIICLCGEGHPDLILCGKGHPGLIRCREGHPDLISGKMSDLRGRFHIRRNVWFSGKDIPAPLFLCGEGISDFILCREGHPDSILCEEGYLGLISGKTSDLWGSTSRFHIRKNVWSWGNNIPVPYQGKRLIFGKGLPGSISRVLIGISTDLGNELNRVMTAS